MKQLFYSVLTLSLLVLFNANLSAQIHEVRVGVDGMF